MMKFMDETQTKCLFRNYDNELIWKRKQRDFGPVLFLCKFFCGLKYIINMVIFFLCIFVPYEWHRKETKHSKKYT